MKITETKAEGLKREFKVVVEASNVAERVENRLKELSSQVRLPGFRPGKVPLNILQHRYGEKVRSEILEKIIGENTKEIWEQKDIKPAFRPQINVITFEDGQDLEYTIDVEILPEVEHIDFKTLSLEKPSIDVNESEIERSLESLSKSQRNRVSVTDRNVVESGDVAIIDFTGNIDGKEFPGGKGEKYPLEIGSGSFIPGFEEQLIGVKIGESCDISVDFPVDYGAKELAGKSAIFSVYLHGIEIYESAEINDELAKKVGLDNLEALRNDIKIRQQKQYAQSVQQYMKRQVLDSLADQYNFDVPESLVDHEYQMILRQFEQRKSQAEKHGEEVEELKEMAEETLFQQYRSLALRRVRLGLVLHDLGKIHNFEITNSDFQKAFIEEIRRYPGQEKVVMEYYQNNPQARTSLEGKLLEDRAVNYILELAQVHDKKMDVESFLKLDRRAEESPND